MQSEDSYHGSLRETEEEFRLTIDSYETPPRLIYSFKNNNYFNDICLIEQEAALSSLHLCEEETSDVRWAFLEKISQMQKEGLFIPLHYPWQELLVSL